MSKNEKDMKWKVLFFDPISRAGGGSVYLLNTIRHYNTSKKFKYIFYCNRAMKERFEKHHFKNDVYKIIYTSKITQKGGIFAFLERIVSSGIVIKKNAPDVIICMNQIPFTTKIPTVLFLRNALYFITDDTTYRGPKSIYYQFRCLFFKTVTGHYIKKATSVITPSNSFARIVKENYKNCKGITAVPFGLNDVVSEEKNNCSIDGQIQLLFLQYNFYKGLDVAIDAIKIIHDKNIDAKLTVTDNIENHHDTIACKIKQTIATNKLYSVINMIGLQKHEDLVKIYRETNIFLFPSFVESFGHGLLEAMANGIPCIVSDISVFEELAGDCVCYFKCGDYNDLADKIIHLSRNTEMRRDLSRKAIEKVKEYTWERHIALVEKKFEEIM